jgi:hypothetical protein
MSAKASAATHKSGSMKSADEKFDLMRAIKKALSG